MIPSDSDLQSSELNSSDEEADFDDYKLLTPRDVDEITPTDILEMDVIEGKHSAAYEGEHSAPAPTQSIASAGSDGKRKQGKA